MEIFKNNMRDESGAAAVEVAILSLVMVPMAIYAIFFFDMALVNLKVSEASRYAVWELSAMPLSAFHETTMDHSKTFQEKVELIKQEVNAIWGDDMTSGTRTDTDYYGLFSQKVTGLSVTEFESSEEGSVIAELTMVGNDNPYKGESASEDSATIEEDVGFIQSVIDLVMGAVGGLASGMFKWFKFNTEGFVEVSLSTKLKFDRKAPIYGDNPMIIGELPQLKSSQKLLVDAWDLKDGGDVDWGQAGAVSGGKNEGYYRQVDRMTFGGFKAKLTGFLGDFGSVFNDVMNFLKIRLPYETEVRSYALKNGSNASGNGCSGAERNVKGCVVLPMPKITAFSDKANYRRAGYYTNVLSDVNNFTENSESPYFQIYKKQSPNNSSSTGYYMGCDQPETYNFKDCWQN